MSDGTNQLRQLLPFTVFCRIRHVPLAPSVLERFVETFPHVVKSLLADPKPEELLNKFLLVAEAMLPVIIRLTTKLIEVLRPGKPTSEKLSD
ncbi:MAG: hypothetical protein JW384_01831 [Nitrosomonadaceae bacterium]|nr:hypothetical protein [Nitrosomonadaceae bacterium]